MYNNQAFWNDLWGWVTAIGFILTVIIIGFIWNMCYENKFRNPFAPFIRAFEKRQAVAHQIRLMKTRNEIIRSGTDPAYVDFMRKEIEKKNVLFC